VLLSNPLRNRQTQACSTQVTAAGWVSTIKSLEDVGQVLWRDPNARITHQKLYVRPQVA
jgi:hypothetical protein